MGLLFPENCLILQTNSRIQHNKYEKTITNNPCGAFHIEHNSSGVEFRHQDVTLAPCKVLAGDAGSEEERIHNSTFASKLAQSRKGQGARGKEQE